MAKAFATLDVISGGRVIMGVGAGHVEGEFDVLGVPFAERGALLDESIDAVRAGFAEDCRPTPAPTWPAADLGQHPRPVQEDGPPIWVGGSSPAAIRRAAQRGDGWLPQGPVTPEIIDAPACREVGRRAGGEPFDFGALVGPVYVGEADWDVGRCITGPPDKIAHILRKFAGLGVLRCRCGPAAARSTSWSTRSGCSAGRRGQPRTSATRTSIKTCRGTTSSRRSTSRMSE